MLRGLMRQRRSGGDLRQLGSTSAWSESAKRLTEDVFGLLNPFSVDDVIFVPGAQKCATSSVFALLMQSRTVRPALRKEPNFFSTEQFLLGDGWYQGQFVPRMGSAVGLDGSTTYAADEFALERIARAVPRARMVMCVRDPVDRLLSHYSHNVRLGAEPESLRVALDRERTAVGSAGRYWMRGEPFRSPASHHLAYVGNSRYSDQIEALLRHGFRVSIVLFSDLVGPGPEFTRALFERLDLEPPGHGGRVPELNRIPREPQGELQRSLVFEKCPELTQHTEEAIRAQFAELVV